MSKPIEFFKTDDEFQRCAKWWQHRLCLDDWIIKFKTTDKILEYDCPECDNAQLSGLCEYNYLNKEASIVVYNSKDATIEDITKDIAELSLVHELLHLKNEYITENSVTGFDNVFYNSIIHQSMECMAKTLIMVKYKVDYDYFFGSDNS